MAIALADAAAPSGPLVDRQGRVIDYLRISVTDRCNYRCSYCFFPADVLGSKLRQYATPDQWRSAFDATDETWLLHITGGEPPKTYQNTIRLGLEDDRIHALILGYWHTIVTPPMVFAKLLAEIVEEMRAKGIHKPVVVSLAGDVEVEEASEYLFGHGIPAYPYSTEIPVDVLGAKYKWARGAGLI